MKSVFRLYAKTSKGNDKYLFQQLKHLGLNPTYEDAIHAFYFDANFKTLFDLSFGSLAVESMYIQLGRRFPSGTEKNIIEGLSRVPFRNYIPIQRGLIQNLTLSIMHRQSTDIPSENVITGLLQSHLNKEIVNKEYKVNIVPQPENRTHLYKEIKSIVANKWNQEDEQYLLYQESRLKQLKSVEGSERKKLVSGTVNDNTFDNNLPARSYSQDDNSSVTISQIQKELTQYQQTGQLTLTLPYNPYLIYYVRKNQGRILLKVNKQQLYKHGWKKSISWGALRESIAASALYRSGLIEEAKQQKQLTLWDPFCGSCTIPLVATSILKSIPVRADYRLNFTWPHWPVYSERLLQQYRKGKESQQKSQDINLRVLASDVSFSAINHSIQNFRSQLENHNTGKHEHQGDDRRDKWINLKPNKQLFELKDGHYYFACQHFETVYEQLLNRSNRNRINIVTNLPYLSKNSAQHIQLNQLVSSYRKFDRMLSKASEFIDNAFVFISLDNLKDSNHFLKVSQEKWELLSEYDSGGIKVGFYGWSRNRIQNYSSSEFQLTEIALDEHSNKNKLIKSQPISESLQEYRKKMQQIQIKRYYLPRYKITKRNRGWRSAQEKAKDRHLKMAYSIFSRKREQQQALHEYINRKVAFKVVRRGLKWKKTNLALLSANPEKYSNALRKEFEGRIQKALEISELKKRSKNIQKTKRVW